MKAEALDKLTCRCGKESCNEPLYIHSRCHPHAGLTATYSKGVVTILCHLCEEEVVKLDIAHEIPIRMREPLELDSDPQ